MGKPTRRFLLANTADSIATRPTRRLFDKAEQSLEILSNFSCCRLFARRKRLLLLSLGERVSNSAHVFFTGKLSIRRKLAPGFAPVLKANVRVKPVSLVVILHVILRFLEHQQANLSMQVCKIMTESHAQTFI